MSSLKELQDLIREKYDIEAEPDASIRDKGFDSLALVEFMFAVEDHFGISLSDEESSIDTLAALAVVVDKALAAKAAQPPAASPAPASSTPAS